MRRVNAVLLVLVIVSALSVITSQHHARKLFSQLEGEQAQATKLGEEFTQLQLEQGTWATNKRVESIASRSRFITRGRSPCGTRTRGIIPTHSRTGRRSSWKTPTCRPATPGT